MKALPYIMDFATTMFKEYPGVASIWNKNIDALSKTNSVEDVGLCSSLRAFLVRIDEIAKEKKLPIKDLEHWLFEYQDEIKEYIQPYLANDYSNQNQYGNRDVVLSLLEDPYVERSSATIITKLIESISKNAFDKTLEYPTVDISDNQIKAIAQIRNTDETKLVQSNNRNNNNELDEWKKMTAEAITSMDDLTADVFDAVSLMWLKQARHKDQMITFHTDDVLNLRKVEGRYNVEGYETGYRSKDRYEIMRRLAALTTIHIEVEKGNVQFVEVSDDNNIIQEELEQVQYNRLFLVDSFNAVYRKGEFVGINECEIKPGRLLSEFLLETKEEHGILAIKTLQYHPTKQKYHKRLARNLSWDWLLNSETYSNQFPIGTKKGLLDLIGIYPEQSRGRKIKDTLEDVLNTLEEDEIIENWTYVGFDEGIIEKTRKWFQYYLEASVMIFPPAKAVEKIQEKQAIQDYHHIISELIHEPVQELLYDGSEITPENIKTERKRRKMTLKELGEELGISHATLSRYERGLIDNPSPATMDKYKKWYYR